MLTDYKISRISRSPDGNGKAVVKFYEGEITTEPEELGQVTQAVTRYRRSKLLRTVDIPLLGRTDEELQAHINTLLADSRTHTPIAEQQNA